MVQVNLESNKLHENIIIEYFPDNDIEVNKLIFDFSYDYQVIAIHAIDSDGRKHLVKTIAYNSLLKLAGKIILKDNQPV